MTDSNYFKLAKEICSDPFIKQKQSETVTIIDVSQFSPIELFCAIPFDDVSETLIQKLLETCNEFTKRYRAYNNYKFMTIDVTKDAKPYVGRVWLSKRADGLCGVYKTNYDSSD
jgi:hypothetical protein